MDQTLFMLPILPGKTEAARAYLQELVACGHGVGIDREVWAIQQTPQGDVFVVYMTSAAILYVRIYVVAADARESGWITPLSSSRSRRQPHD